MTRAKLASAREKAKRAQLSCFTCRARKVKCDRLLPCAACAQYQNPEGCRYDMSDDKRQPILMADANKQLRRENVELKTRNLERLSENELLKAENRGVKALATELRARLAAVEQDSPSSMNQVTVQGSSDLQHQMHYQSHRQGISASRSRSVRDNASTVVEHYMPFIPGSSPNYELNKSEAMVLHQGFLASFEVNQSTTASRVLTRANEIVSYCQSFHGADVSILEQSVYELDAMLKSLPRELQFSNHWYEHPRSIPPETPSLQALLLSQKIRTYIIVLLSQMSHTCSTTCPDQRIIRLPEPLRTQMITSCLDILAILDHSISQGEDDAPIHTGLYSQASVATHALTHLDSPSHILPYYSHLQLMINHLQNNQGHVQHSPPGYVSNALIHLVSKMDQYIKANHTTQASPFTINAIQPASSWSRPFLEQSTQHHNQNDLAIVKKESGNEHLVTVMMDSRSIDESGRPALEAAGSNLSRLHCHAPPWHFIDDVSDGSDYGVEVKSSGHGIQSTISSDTMSIIHTPGMFSVENTTASVLGSLSSQLSCSATSMTSPFDHSYPPSVYTTASSQYSSRGSHPVSPVYDQERTSGCELGATTFDHLKGSFRDPERYWCCDYV